MTILQVGVKAFLRNKDGKYLLLKRNSEKYSNVKCNWDIVGGRINPGITLLDNLKREIEEETQLVLISKPRLIASQDILRNEGVHVVRLTYIAECGGSIVIDTSENTEFRWLTPDEFKRQDDLDIFVKDLIEDKTIFKLL